MSKQKFVRNAFTSQRNNRQRQPFSLKNLFTPEMLQNNFMSLASQKLQSSSRPQTMNCGRIKQKIYAQTVANSRNQKRCLQINFKTQSKMLRNKSQQFKRSSSYHCSNMPAEVKQIVPMEEKIKMKKALGKINLLAQDQFQAQQQQKIQSIFNFLQCLSQNQHFYQTAFKFLTSHLKNQIFMQKQNLSEQEINLLKILIQTTNNTELISLIHGRDSEKTTFKNVIKEVIKQFIAIDQKMHINDKRSQQQLTQLKCLIQQKQQTLSKIVKKVKYLEQHPSENRYSYILQLETKLENANKQLEQNLFSIRVLNHNLEIISETNMKMLNNIQKLKTEITQYQIQKQSGLKTVQKSSQLKNFESNVSLLKQMMDKSIIKMSGMKEQYQKMKDYNVELQNQRDKLAKRAAVGFGQLTPRPNLKKIFTFHNLDYQTIFEQPKKMSTQRFVQKLLQKFKQYYESHKVVYKNIDNQFKKDRNKSQLQLQKGRSAQLVQNISSNKHDNKKQNLTKFDSTSTREPKQKSAMLADSVINQLQKTKRQIQKSVMAAEQVKIAYSKQKFKGN